MQPGQKMNDGQGHQVCLFPLTQMNITQWHGPGAYSHCCGNMVDYGTNGVPTPVYAPCDMHLTYDPHTVPNTLFYCSDQQVLTPDGLHWVSIQFTHANNPPRSQTVKQGDVIYYSGTAGGVALHLHMDQSFIKDARWIDSGHGCVFPGNCMYLNGTTEPQHVFFINDTAIVNDHGEQWYYFHADDPPIPPEPEPPDPPIPSPATGGNFKWYLYKQLFDRRLK